MEIVRRVRTVRRAGQSMGIEWPRRRRGGRCVRYMTSLMSAVAIIFVTELEFLQRVFKTVELTGDQWLICIGAGATILVVSEIYKFVLRRRPAATGGP